MKLHSDELDLARAYTGGAGFEALTHEQVRAIVGRGRDLHRWFKSHPRAHALVNVTVIVAIFVGDWWILTWLPRRLVPDPGAAGAAWILFAAAIVGALHSWLSYSWTIFSLHEGASHNLIFPGAGVISRIGQFLGRNMCRLSNAEPNHYAACHMAHHAQFGTEHDSEFLNFVGVRRLWLVLLPFGTFMNVSDFMIHRPPTYTASRVLSMVISGTYNGLYAYLMYSSVGALFTFVVFVVMLPHVGFWTDRLRQFTEHNLMPLENSSGSRSFGIGFWGLLIGGGPWGQPCHLVHHLVPSIPWYQQLLLHRYLVTQLTPRQRSQFLVRPIVGYPLLVWSIVRESRTFSGRWASRAVRP